MATFLLRQCREHPNCTYVTAEGQTPAHWPNADAPAGLTVWPPTDDEVRRGLSDQALMELLETYTDSRIGVLTAEVAHMREAVADQTAEIAEIRRVARKLKRYAGVMERIDELEVRIDTLEANLAHEVTERVASVRKVARA